MANVTISQIIDSILFGDQMFRTLREVRFASGTMGRPRFTVGRHSVLFDVKIDGVHYGLKCYTSPQPTLEDLCHYASTIPSDILIHPTPLPQELWAGDRWLDVVLYPWVEGRTFAWEIRKALHDQRTASFEALLDGFSSLMLSMLRSEWRHGDIKPDNIIVHKDRSMTLVDCDALYIPRLPSRGETGTPPFVHPTRGEAYDSNIDDFAIALISTSLSALSREPRMVTSEPMVSLPSEGRQSLLLELFKGNEPLNILLSHLNGPNYKIDNLKELTECIRHK